jgi:hypothetical protein
MAIQRMAGILGEVVGEIEVPPGGGHTTAVVE